MATRTIRARASAATAPFAVMLRRNRHRITIHSRGPMSVELYFALEIADDLQHEHADDRPGNAANVPAHAQGYAHRGGHPPIVALYRRQTMRKLREIRELAGRTLLRFEPLFWAQLAARAQAVRPSKRPNEQRVNVALLFLPSLIVQ